MPHEIEVKFKVASHAAVRRRLRALGGAYRSTVIQDDGYFDTSTRALLADQVGLRVREVRVIRTARGARVDDRPQLTYKGPLQSHRRAKVRREIQTHFDTRGAVEDVLLALGHELVMSYQKRRTTYLLGRCLVELDELPLLGSFVEIEGTNERKVFAVARKLGLTGESIKASYSHMMVEACRAKGRKAVGIRLRRKT